MSCKRCSKTPKWVAAWRRQRCTECRAAIRADEAMARGVEAMRGDSWPADGLANALTAVTGIPLPADNRKPQRTSWRGKLALAGATCAVAGLITAFVLREKQTIIPKPDSPQTMARQEDNGRNNTIRVPLGQKVMSKAPAVKAPPVQRRESAEQRPGIPITRKRHRVRAPKWQRMLAMKPESETGSGLSVQRPHEQLVDNAQEVETTPQPTGGENKIVLAAYGVDGDRPVRYTVAQHYVINGGGIKRGDPIPPPTPRHIYVIDRLSATPHEPQVASSTDRAKELQIW